MYIDIRPYGVIYKITNVLNGKIYIGQTKDFNRRFNEYKTRKIEDNHRYNYGIMREINKVGFDNFKFEVIDCAFNKDDLNKLEKYYIIKYDSINPDVGYNSRTGDLREPLNANTRQIMSKAHIGLKETSETKRKKSKPVLAFKDKKVYIADSGKLFADFIGSSKDMVNHAITKGMKIKGFYVFRLNNNKDLSSKYRKLKDTKYYKLYKLVEKGVETIERLYDVEYITYD